MNKHWVMIGFLLITILGHAQPKAAQALEGDYPLQQRFQLMKENSQTFQDYKVIKGYVLDGFWKITMDSLRAVEKGLTLAEERINQLESQVKIAEANLAKKESSMQQMEYDSKHITVAGISFSKGVFLNIAGLTILGLILVLASVVGALKLAQRAMKEKSLALYGVSAEFDEYRKKALDKEIKLSRQLQNERNKLAELSK